MGIINIHILTEPDDRFDNRVTQEITVAREAELIAAHRRAEHIGGALRRDCPLCQPVK